jgi:hypothetical protein
MHPVQLEVEHHAVAQGIESLEHIPGRFERVDAGQDFLVIVDYAHTEDGLHNVLKAARTVCQNRVICVFGCGGDRDKTKRPKMAAVAARQADFAIVTSDLARFDPASQVLVCAFSRSRLVVVDAAAIDWIEADAVTVSDSAPRSVRNAVRSWAKKAGKPLVDFRRAATNAWCLVAGLPADEKDLQNVRQTKRVLKAVPQYDLAAAAAPEFQSPFLDGAVPQQDPGLIGGVVTQIGDLVLDGSIRTQLLNMRESMKRGEGA